MSSSDSDYDCYSGAAGLLDELKSRFTSQEIMPKKDDVSEMIDACDKNINGENTTWKEIQDSFQLPEYILKKQQGQESIASSRANIKFKGKGRKTRNSQKSDLEVETPITPMPKRKKVEKSQNKRRTSQRNRAPTLPQYPTFIAGEAEGYIDHSADVQLFQNRDPEKNNQQEHVDRILNVSDSDSEGAQLDESLVNPIVSVKVHWRSKDFKKFSIRKFQKVTSIFEYFSKANDAKWENLYFDYNGHILTPSDTPDSINYNIGKFIEGGVVTQNIYELTKYKDQAQKENNLSSLNVKFQVANRKNPVFVKLGPKEKFLLAMVKLAEELGVSRTTLKFTFDGDILDAQSTPEDLSFEGGECVDVAGEN